MSNTKKYYAKVLLFGEYGVIYGSMGLSVPFNLYAGCFENSSQEITEDVVESNKSLNAFHDYLFQLKEKNELIANINLEKLKEEIDNGLYFKSDIPQGFGVGSSGAVCAGIYDQYANDKIILTESNWDNHVMDLKNAFVQMESYFHGTSSGLDPLNCYLHKPLHIKGKNDIGLAEMNKPANLDVFLINTGTVSKTGPLVNLFFDKLRDYSFYKKFHDGFLPANNNCILAYLAGETDLFYENLSGLSALTLELFDPMIPDDFHGLWRRGLESKEFLLKLCGSGGGGFLLGFTKDLNKIHNVLAEAGYNITPWQEK